MDPRIYHGDLTPSQIAVALIAKFNHGNLRAQQLGSHDQVVVQIATREGFSSGGQTALSVSIQKVADGVAVQVGKQDWLGVAANLGMTAFSAMRNPWSLVGRLNDIAQDIENIQLIDSINETIDEVARGASASFELSDRLKRMVCEYCNTANPVGEPACIACGAPLGSVQPTTCPHCGFVLKTGETACPNCGQKIY
jgi:DNA-directed RNA polymerase subunit RPC12/RpoP